MTFSYNNETRELVCQPDTTKTYRVKFVTARQSWLDKYPGPNVTVRIGGLNDHINPFEDFDYVYHDGFWIETIPMKMDVEVPEDKVNLVKSSAISQGYDVIINHIFNKN